MHQSPHRRRHRRGPRRSASLLLAVLTTSALVLTGCGGSGRPSATPPAGGSSAGGATNPSSSASGTSTTRLRYVAIGDSYSAAPGVPVTDVANGCFRSSGNYPSLVAKATGAALVDRTCASAETADLLRSQRQGTPPQVTALKADTQLVTVGMGGNDEKVFGRLVYQCTGLRSRDPQGAPCRAALTRGGSDALSGALDRTAGRMTALLKLVHRRSPDAKVLVIGYPHIVSAQHVCARIPLARGDFAYGEQMNRRLNAALRRAARATGSTYVDVYAASRDHDICAADPWINGSADSQKAVRYHPFAVEQEAVATLVEKAVDR